MRLFILHIILSILLMGMPVFATGTISIGVNTGLSQDTNNLENEINGDRPEPLRDYVRQFRFFLDDLDEHLIKKLHKLSDPRLANLLAQLRELAKECEERIGAALCIQRITESQWTQEQLAATQVWTDWTKEWIRGYRSRLACCLDQALASI